MKRTSWMLIGLSFLFSACNDNAIFEKEMYKNVVALISSGQHNIFEEEVALVDGEVLGYISVSVGGTQAPTQDLKVDLTEDQAPLDKYNWSQFYGDERLYAKLLPADKYEIEDYSIQVKAGERTGRTMVRLNPEGLSPDSTYFIGLKMTGREGVEINENKNTILYQVLIKNDYASLASNSFYSMSGMANGMVTAGNKKLFPLSKNTVRVIAGNETFSSTEKSINEKSIILEINEDNSVTIKPYKDINVKMIDGDSSYPNSFEIEESYGRVINVFLLSYEYTIGNKTVLMKERLEMQVK